ncbi:hypothetical protein ACN42_g11839, partial [Penicillium freii]
GKPSPSENAC